MNWLDAAIIGIILWFTISAFQAGFIRETVTIVAAVVGIVLAGIFYKQLAEDVLLFIDNATLARIVAFGVIFGAVALAGQIMAMVLKPTVNILQLGIFDQLAGAAFGFAKGIVFVEAFMIIFITYPKWGLKQDIDQSYFGSMIMEKTPVLVHILPNEFQISVRDFTGKIPASLPGSDYQYQPPGNIPPVLNP
jgi:membrane protein required for colicin V production